MTGKRCITLIIISEGFLCLALLFAVLSCSTPYDLSIDMNNTAPETGEEICIKPEPEIIFEYDEMEKYNDYVVYVDKNIIYIRNINNDNVTAISEGQSASWGPDGTILFSSNGEIYSVYYRNSSSTTKIIEKPEHCTCYSPFWSTDLEVIVYVLMNNNTQSFEFYQVKLDGSNNILLSDTLLFEGFEINSDELSRLSSQSIPVKSTRRINSPIISIEKDELGYTATLQTLNGIARVRKGDLYFAKREILSWMIGAPAHVGIISEITENNVYVIESLQATGVIEHEITDIYEDIYAATSVLIGKLPVEEEIRIRDEVIQLSRSYLGVRYQGKNNSIGAWVGDFSLIWDCLTGQLNTVGSHDGLYCSELCYIVYSNLQSPYNINFNIECQGYYTVMSIPIIILGFKIGEITIRMPFKSPKAMYDNTTKLSEHSYYTEYDVTCKDEYMAGDPIQLVVARTNYSSQIIFIPETMIIVYKINDEDFSYTFVPQTNSLNPNETITIPLPEMISGQNPLCPGNHTIEIMINDIKVFTKTVLIDVPFKFETVKTIYHQLDEIFCHLSFTNPTDSEIHIPFLKNGTITPIYSDFVQFYLDNSTESITPYFFNFFANEIIVPPHDTYSIEVSFLVPEIDFHIITAKTIYGDYTASFNVTETITIINEEEHYYAYIDENANSSIFYIEIYYPLPGPVTDWTDRCIRFRYSNVNDIENEVFVVRAFIKTDIPYLQGILEITANTTGTLEISFNAWPTYTVDNDVYFEVYKKESGLMLFETEHILLM